MSMYTEQLPPHNQAAEESVVGSLLIDGDAIMKVVGLIKPESFYTEKVRWVYEACLGLWEEREAINGVTVGHRLAISDRLEGVGGSSYLGYLIGVVPTSMHIEHYAKIVAHTHTRRRLINAAGEIASIGQNGAETADTAISQAEDLLFAIRSGQGPRGFQRVRDVLDQFLEDRADPSVISGNAPMPTGFLDIDRLLGGLRRSDMFVLAARPGVGKSALSLNMAKNVAEQGGTVAIFSLEMSAEQLVHRLIADQASVDLHRLRLSLYSEIEERRIINAVGELSDLPIYIDDSPLQGFSEMRSKARRLQMEVGLDLVVVDYLQLMHGNPKANRVEQVSEISRSLKAMARELNVNLLAVSQLSRAVESRPNKRPQLSDIRESGAIEQDADVVAFIYRDDYYFTEEEWHKEMDTPYPQGIAEFIVAKHRNGPIDTVQLRFAGHLSRFENLAKEME